MSVLDTQSLVNAKKAKEEYISKVKLVVKDICQMEEDISTFQATINHLVFVLNTMGVSKSDIELYKNAFEKVEVKNETD